MSANPDTAAPKGRKKPVRGKEHSAALGYASQNRSSPEGATQESANSLLKLLLAQRESGFRGRGKYQQPTAPDLEGLPKPPDGWIWASPEQLANAAPHSLGIGPFGSNLKVSDYQETGTPLIFVRNIRAEDFSLVAKFVTEEKANELAAHTAEGGDILITKMGEPPGDAAFYPVGAPKAVITADCIKWRLADDLRVPKFFVYAIRSPLVQQQIQNRTRGVAQKKISLERFRDLAIPVPPLPEQRRIVAEIEKQFTRLEAGVAALRRVQANLKRYRASVLKAACEGRLVSKEAELAKKERRKFEPASELIARTPTPPRPNRWNSRSKDVIPGHHALAVGNPQTELPEGWAWSALVEIAKMESGHTPSRNHSEWWDGDVAWIGIADARERDGRTIHETFQHTNLEGIANSASRLLPAGTVCISRTASVGYVVVMGREMATSQDFVNWIPTHAVTSGWLRVIFSADREALRRFGKGSVHKTIYFPEWLSVHIAVPPLAEQTRIVAEVERRLSVVEELEAVVTANLQRATRLRQSILQKAFTEELHSTKRVK